MKHTALISVESRANLCIKDGLILVLTAVAYDDPTLKKSREKKPFIRPYHFSNEKHGSINFVLYITLYEKCVCVCAYVKYVSLSDYILMLWYQCLYS